MLSRAVFGLTTTGTVDADEAADDAEKFAMSCSYGGWLPSLHTDLTIYRANPSRAATDYARDRASSQVEKGWTTTDLPGVADEAFVATSPEAMGLVARARRGNAYIVAIMLISADDIGRWKTADAADLLNSLLAPVR